MKEICVYRDDKLFFHHSLSPSPRAEDFEMHAHETHEILVFLSGNCRFLVEGKEYELSPGSILITRAGETHKMLVQGDRPYERVSLNFDESLLSSLDPDGELIEPFSARKLGTYNLFTSENWEGILRPVLMLDQQTPPNRIRLVLISFLLSALVDISQSFRTEVPQGSERAEFGRNFEIIEYINTNLAEDLSLEYLASRFYISKSQLNRTFKKITGSTLWDYVIIKRLLLAKTYIKNGESISEAYKKCGFNDYSSFYRAYTKRFGVSPKKDR